MPQDYQNPGVAFADRFIESDASDGLDDYDKVVIAFNQGVECGQDLPHTKAFFKKIRDEPPNKAYSVSVGAVELTLILKELGME